MEREFVVKLCVLYVKALLSALASLKWPIVMCVSLMKYNET